VLDKCKVVPDDKQTLLSVLGPMKKDIVEKQLEIAAMCRLTLPG
jgi:hypothetical protein